MTSFDKKIKEKIVKLKKEKNRMFIGRNKIEIINKKDNILNLLAIIFKEYGDYNIPYIECVKK